MNRLTKSSLRRGNGVPRTRSRGLVASTPAAGASASRILPAGASVPVSHASSINASTVDGWWPTLSPSEG